MKKLIVVALGLLCAGSLMVQAQDAHPKQTEEQKAAQKELLGKYDTNKDGKLDKEERGKMSKEDKEKWSKATGHKMKEEAAPAPAAPAK